METISRREILLSSTGLAGLAPIAAPGSPTPPGREGSRVERKLKVVVVGGHPDDPETGVGGTIARYADEGHEVVCLYLTRGEAGIRGKTHEEAAAVRTAEAEAACRVLVAKALFAGQIDGATEINAERYEQFGKLLGKIKPDIVFTHWPIDSHRDHRVASLLVYDAWLKAGKRFALCYYEVYSGIQTQHFHPTHYVDITQTEARKREAVFCHRSQNPERMWKLHSLMDRFRGTECRRKTAEAFVRHVNSSTGLVL